MYNCIIKAIKRKICKN